MKKNIFYSILFLFFIFIFSIFFISLDKPNLYAPKQVKNKILAEFSSNELFLNKKFKSNDIIQVNKFTIVNIWSSWCIPCKQEHSLLMNLKEKTDINIIGLNYKDKKNNAINFINELGNPYSKILTDPDGIISISLGAYGVPETFLLNNKSKVIRKYIGPLNNDHVLEIINIIKS
tara:strand:- start:83 stop:607 length:525 start_codon:yes stop_codon:yes gene_type:complete